MGKLYPKTWFVRIVMHQLSWLKNSLTRPGISPRRIVAGLNRGLMMHLDLREDLQRLLGLYEKEVSGFVDAHAKSINTAIDIGAGEGFYTIFFLAKTQAERVFAFEPAKEARDLLMMNLKANALDADTRLVVSSEFMTSRCSTGTTNLELLASQIRLPCLVKIDVEGAEADVLAGAGALLNLPRVSWMIETHSRKLEEQCRDFLSKAGYQTTVVPNAWWRRFVPELRPIAHNRWLLAESCE